MACLEVRYLLGVPLRTSHPIPYPKKIRQLVGLLFSYHRCRPGVQLDTVAFLHQLLNLGRIFLSA